MNFNMFPSSSRVDCAIQINFNLDAVDIKGGSCYDVNDINRSEFYPG